MPLKLYNTLTRRVEPFVPADPARVTFYTCGPTVYDDAHIGNFRSFLAADLLRRWIESPLCEVATASGAVHRGSRRVVHVMNITDVGHMTDDAAPGEGGGSGEDRMAVAGRRLLEAKKSGKLPAGVEVDASDPFAVARFYEARFREDARRLGLRVADEADRDPTLMPRATEHVRGMIRVVQRLLDRGFAYVAGGVGARVVYFAVQAFPGYGRLSGNTLDKLRVGEGGRIRDEHQAQKKHPADFLLWKEDPRHLMKWPSPWGEGYPGWHIECSAMSLGRLGAAGRGSGGDAPLTPEAFDALLDAGVPDAAPLFDLHSGGEDNIFPHHECEIAQSCAAFNATPDGAPLAAMWFHPRFLLVNGEKMSKSKGNFYTPRDLFDRGHEPAAVRLEIIKTHYRANADFNEEGLRSGQSSIGGWRSFAKLVLAALEVKADVPNDQENEIIRKAVEDGVGRVQDAMNNDLQVARLISAMHRLCGPRGAFSAVADIDARARGHDPDRSDWTQRWAEVDALKLPARCIDAATAYRLLQDPYPLTHLWGAFHLLDAILGVVFVPVPVSTKSDVGLFAPGVSPDAAVIALLEERRAARAAKDFKRSDAIRDELLRMGYAIKDAPGGKVEVSRALRR